MGLTASIFVNKQPGYANCSLGGLSQRYEQVCIVNAEGPSEPSRTCPAVLIESHVPGIVRAVPAAKNDAGKWVVLDLPDGIGPMAGGAFIATSDSRFNELVRKLIHREFYGAVAFHDRYETEDLYNKLSQ